MCTYDPMDIDLELGLFENTYPNLDYYSKLIPTNINTNNSLKIVTYTDIENNNIETTFVPYVNNDIDYKDISKELVDNMIIDVCKRLDNMNEINNNNIKLEIEDYVNGYYSDFEMETSSTSSLTSSLTSSVTSSIGIIDNTFIYDIVLIQKQIRRYLVKKRYLDMQCSIKIIQNYIRGHQTRTRYLKTLDSVKIIQNFFRKKQNIIFINQKEIFQNTINELNQEDNNYKCIIM